MRIILSLIFTACLASSAYADVYVLCYHSFLGRKQVAYDFSNEELRSHLKFFSDRGFRFISLKDLQDGRVSGGKNILVTIDDGNHSVYRAYYDVFKPLGIRPLLSIYPNIIGKKEYALNWQQLKQLAGDGCDIASHGYFHLKLNKKLHDENRQYFMQEVVKSKKVLEEKLGTSITSFVYPFGLNTDAGEEALRGAGYNIAFTIVNNPVKFPLSRNQNIMRLPRYMLTRSHYQGSLNHIANIAGRGDRSAVTADSRPPRREFMPLSAGDAVSKSIEMHAGKKQSEALKRNGRKKAHEDIRMGVAYDDSRGPEKGVSHNGRKKKRKSSARKKEVTMTPPAPIERQVAVVDEVRKSVPADQVFQYNLSHGSAKAGGDAGVRKSPPAAERENLPHMAASQGRIREKWNSIMADIIGLYQGVIRAHFRKAEKYMQILAARIAR